MIHLKNDKGYKARCDEKQLKAMLKAGWKVDDEYRPKVIADAQEISVDEEVVYIPKGTVAITKGDSIGYCDPKQLKAMEASGWKVYNEGAEEEEPEEEENGLQEGNEEGSEGNEGESSPEAEEGVNDSPEADEPETTEDAPAEEAAPPVEEAEQAEAEAPAAEEAQDEASEVEEAEDMKSFLATLDPNDDAQWTKLGQVLMSVVEAKFPDATRDDVEAAWPNFRRETLKGE